MARLTGQEFEQLQRALLSAFPSDHLLAELVRFGLDEDLDAITQRSGLKGRLFELITWIESKSQVGKLVAQALKLNPENADLKVFAADFASNADRPSSSANIALSRQTDFWRERRADLYLEASRAVARLATAKDRRDVAAAEQTFWELYWGPLSIVEHRSVEAAMVEFGEALGQWTKGEAPEVLRSLSFQLAKSMQGGD